MSADTFANFSCEGHDRRDAFRVQTLRNERMSSAGNESMHEGVTAHGRRVALAAASLGLLFCATVSAAEPLVIVKYQSVGHGGLFARQSPSRGGRPMTRSAVAARVPRTACTVRRNRPPRTPPNPSRRPPAIIENTANEAVAWC